MSRDRENSGLFGHQKLGAVLIVLGALCAFCVLLCPPAFGQGAAGSVSGVVLDTSGAVIPGASVTLANTATGVKTTTETNNEGLYTFPYVQPGVYDVTASASGFETVKRPGVTVNVTERVQISFDLRVGTTKQTVEVTGAAPLLHTADAVTGQTINRTFINDLPLLNRSALDLAFLTPGVVQPPNTTYANSGGPANNFNSNGSRDQTSDLTIDGVTAGQVSAGGLWIQPAYTPSVDAVQEYKVQQTNFSAEYGFTGSTITNLVTRSGTDSFHGSAYDFLRNNDLDAQNFFNNQSTVPTVHNLPHLERNVFGGTFGGPVHIPHLYNGKNRTFFFFDYEGTRESDLAGPFQAGVPSAAEKNGDFGEFCAENGGTYNAAGQCSKASGQLWDPYTGVYQPGVGTPRSAFIPNNNLATYASPGTNLPPGGTLPGGPLNTPGNLIDPSMKLLFAYFPAPNSLHQGSGGAYDPYFNWLGSGASTTNNDQWDLKIDHNFSDNNRLSARYSRQKSGFVPPSCYNDVADPCKAFASLNTAHLFSLGFVHTFGPTTVLDFTYGLTRTANAIGGTNLYYPASKTDPVTNLKMPSYIDTSGYTTFPTVISNGSELAPSSDNSTLIGSAPWSYLRQGQETHDLLASLNHIQGRHELKAGGEFRMHRFNAGQPGTPNGLFAYGPMGTSQTGNWDGSGGDTLADMLIGGAGSNWGQYEIPDFLATQNFAWAGYAQDAFHASRKLTVNVGLRYDLTLPQTERWNRLSWFDPNAPNPLENAAGQPFPNLHGGLMFSNPNQRSNFNADYRDFQPRLGVAYALNDKTVIRTGYGIYYVISNSVANADAISPNAPGFYAPTNWQTTVPGYPATPQGGLVNPFPQGLVPITGSSLGLLTDIQAGQAVDYFRTWNQTPYEQSWSFGIQRQLPGNMMFETDYIGKKGTHEYFGHSGDFNLNHLGPDEEKHIGDMAWNVAMATQVPNPFYGAGKSQGVVQQGDLLSPTVSQYALSVPYPQFNGVDVQGAPWANSSYQALQLRFEKRFSNGLQLLATYVWSKTIDESSDSGNGAPNIGVLDPNNFLLERAVSQYNIPQVFQFTYVYQLPFGRGKQFGAKMNPVLDAIVGGWQTTGIWRFDDGQPLQIALSSTNHVLPGYGQTTELVGTPKINPKSAWLTQGYLANPQVFQEPAAYTIGNTPRTLPGVNVPGTANADLSLFKEFLLNRVREGSHLELRSEWFNSFNHPQFCGPNNSFGAANFNTVTHQCNSSRQIQMALKFYF
jgi:hypothetical protein